MIIDKVKQELRKHSSPEHAKLLQRYFKTGKGEYAHGDVFIGLKVPQIRKVAKQFKDLSLKETTNLLHSKIHEERLTALLILVDQFQKASNTQKEKIFKMYLKNTKYINNWDLVDLSAAKIVGEWVRQNNIASKLLSLAKSDSLWERRIAIISTFAFINNGELKPSIKIAYMLLKDKHDLIHKAVGWVLREVGKKDQKLLEAFIEKNYSQIPRTALRYAIERFSETKRVKYLNLKK